MPGHLPLYKGAARKDKKDLGLDISNRPCWKVLAQAVEKPN